MHRDSENADLFRKLDAAYADIAAQNRAKYSTAEELETAIYWKYFSKDSAYAGYSREEKNAMYHNEVNMTEFGYIASSRINIPDLLKDPHLQCEVTANSYAATHSRAFNEDTLSAQIGNVFQKYGLNPSLFGNSSFRFSVDGMTKRLFVSLLSADEESSVNADLLKQMTAALNSENNAENLFYNLLYDGTKQGTHAQVQLAKWSLWSNFQRVTGEDIRSFTQTADGFVKKSGETARDIFKEALKTTPHVPNGFKGAAYDYFLAQEANALQYNMAATPDLTLALSYQNGKVSLTVPTSSHFEASI